MNDRMRTGMAEATRLTRAGQLIEATAIIQRTLRGLLAPDASPNTTDRATAEPLEVAFRVVDAAPPPTAVATQGSDQQTSTSAVATLPPPDVAVSPHKSGRAAVALTDTQPDPGEAQHSQAPSTLQPTRGSEGDESTPAALRQPARCRATLRPPRSGLGGPLFIPMPDRARHEIWAGGQFIDGSHTNHAGTRTYKLYIPSGYREQALPLVVMLHGCTQTPDDFAAGTRMNGLAERELFFVVYPAQAPSANPSKCWHWFKATDQHRGLGEPSLIADITRQIVSTYHVNAQRVYIAGLSAGGAMAVIMGVSYPDLYAAIGVHSGLAYGAAHDLPSALAAMQHGGTSVARTRDSRFPAAMTTRGVPTIVFHGDRDTTVHPRNGDQVLAHWTTTHAGGGPDTVAGAKLRVTVNRGQVPEGHAYTRAIYHDASGHTVMEQWLVHEAGHGWSGGSPYGSFTDPKGPDASQAMVRFFWKHPLSES
jgi:poly(hydroxyalkanoate) depolymerase family esterase